MFDFDTVIELMKKYGYSSTSVHPYIYQSGDNLGICYTYIDDEYGLLERIKIFDDLESFEDFLKQLEFVRNHGKENNIRMVLDNYESMNPKVVFLRNEMIMLEGEMFNIEDFDRSQKQRDQLDAVTQVIYKAGDLLLVYDEIKGRQLQYLRNIINLKNTLRRKYFELQKEIDTYNKYKVERALNLLPDINDIGINDRMEIAIKDRYNMYIAQPPSYEEAVDFLREVWDLNKNLELNRKYYEAQKDENDTRNEIKVVDAKLELMRSLNDDYKPLFGIDLVSRFRKINKKYNLVNNKMSDDMVTESLNNIERKYSIYDYIDVLSTSDYLREAMQNTNYGDLAIKYSNTSNRNMVITNKLPLNEAAASLSIQYRDKLTVQEQAIMVLYNNHKYRKLCNAILEIDDFDTLPVKKVISKISSIKGFSKIKSECYDIVKKRIDDPINVAIKTSLFVEYDFTSFETFISSLIKELVKLRHVNRKMMISGNINMYLQTKKVEDVTSKKFVMVTNDLNGLLNETKENNNMVGIVLLKEETPVLYSPYYFDIGDIYTKGASLQMYIREMINFELLIEINDIAINIDPVKTNVVRYYTKPEVYDNISVVEDIMMNYKTTFCKYSFRNNLPVIQQEVIPNSVSLASAEVQSSNVTNDVQVEESPTVVQEDASVSQPTNVVVNDGLNNVKKSEHSMLEGGSVNSVVPNGDNTQVSTNVIDKPEQNEVVENKIDSNVLSQEEHNVVEEKKETISTSSSDKVEPVQNIKSETKKVEDNQEASVKPVSQNDAVSKDVLEKNVTQQTSKPVVSAPSTQTVVKKVDNSQNQVKSNAVDLAKVGVLARSNKQGVDSSVKPSTIVTSVSNDVAEKNETLSKNVTQKKVVVSSVAGQKPTKASVVVNSVGTSVHPVQSSQNKPEGPTKMNSVTNVGEQKNNDIVEKNKVDGVK